MNLRPHAAAVISQQKQFYSSFAFQSEINDQL